MAILPSAFDATQHEEMSDFSPIPKGVYVSQIMSSELKRTAAGNGQYIKLEFEVMQGEYRGRKIWTNLNIVNPNPQAVQIAQKELTSICKAVGKHVIKDTQELHGIPFNLTVSIKPAKGDYAEGNKTSGYAPLKGATSSAQPASSGSATDSSKPPWA